MFVFVIKKGGTPETLLLHLTPLTLLTPLTPLRLFTPLAIRLHQK